jgi:hypothetical protein
VTEAGIDVSKDVLDVAVRREKILLTSTPE